MATVRMFWLAWVKNSWAGKKCVSVPKFRHAWAEFIANRKDFCTWTLERCSCLCCRKILCWQTQSIISFKWRKTQINSSAAFIPLCSCKILRRSFEAVYSDCSVWTYRVETQIQLLLPYVKLQLIYIYKNLEDFCDSVLCIYHKWLCTLLKCASLWDRALLPINISLISCLGGPLFLSLTSSCTHASERRWFQHTGGYFLAMIHRCQWGAVRYLHSWVLQLSLVQPQHRHVVDFVAAGFASAWVFSIPNP